MANGNPHGAHSWMCQLGESERFSILPLYPADMTDEPRLVHIALAVKDNALAAHVGDLSEQRAALNPENTSLAAVAAHTRGLLRRERDDLASAADLFTLGNRPLAAAAALEHFGVQAVDDRDTEGAITAFNRSLAISTDASATWDAARLRGRLRALGVRRRLARPSRHTTGWESLTETEAAVARLVAEGLSTATWPPGSSSQTTLSPGTSKTSSPSSPSTRASNSYGSWTSTTDDASSTGAEKNRSWPRSTACISRRADPEGSDTRRPCRGRSARSDRDRCRGRPTNCLSGRGAHRVRLWSAAERVVRS